MYAIIHHSCGTGIRSSSHSDENEGDRSQAAWPGRQSSNNRRNPFDITVGQDKLTKMAVTISLFVFFCVFTNSLAFYGVPRCGNTAVEVAVTRTVIQTNFIPITTTINQVITATSLITTTTPFPSTVSQVEVVTLVQEPVLLPETFIVTQTRVQERSLVYTSTDYTATFVTESLVAADVLPVYITTHGYITSTLQSIEVIPSQLTSRIILTKLVTETSLRTSTHYQPKYITKTQTKSYFITRTVYQKKIVKSTVDMIQTVAVTSTVNECDPGYMNRFFG